MTDPTRLDSHGQPLAPFNSARISDRAIDEMIGICRGVAADGAVNPAEARFLLGWIERNRDVAGTWPADVLFLRLEAALQDGHLDTEEAADLLTLLHEITGGGTSVVEQVASYSSALPLCSPAPPIVFDGRAFCLTGKFVLGTRTSCQEAVESRGGTAQSNPTRKTDFLVIGSIGSTDWIHSTHGRKIESAVALKRAGRPISIVSEEHWGSFLR